MNNSVQIRRLAELIVRFGANIQPGQIVALASEPGKEPLTRAVAEVAYEQGAKFVDLQVFDVVIKHARIKHADPETLSFVPSWYGDRLLALGEHRGARIALDGPVAPRIMEDLDPALVGRDMLPRLREGGRVMNARSTNWTVAPCPNPGWAELVYPELEPDAALERLWQDVGYICRINEDDPVAAWEARLRRLLGVAAKLDALRLDALRFQGPGTDLVIGLLPSSRWQAAKLETVDGIAHVPNIPTEEIFTSPDPERTSGVVTATKPLFVSGAMVTGLRVEFENGRAVKIDADQGAGTLRALSERDAGAARLGEVALVDGEGRIGPLGTVFYDTLLDENAASHLALGQGFTMALDGDGDHDRLNHSEIHIDFMIGSPEVSVSGIAHDGRELPLLVGGVWQI